MKMGESVRVCKDFRVTVNSVLEAKQYHLPHIEDLFEGLDSGKKFCKIYLNQASRCMWVSQENYLPYLPIRASAIIMGYL